MFAILLMCFETLLEALDVIGKTSVNFIVC